jgi:release factor glutamine methyltransferase
MTLGDVLYQIRCELAKAKIDRATAEAELLLCHTLGISRTQVYTEPERLLTNIEANRLRHVIQRRLLHEPTAYILRCCEFYGIEFYIDRRALIPRPETELLVEEGINFALHHLACGKRLTIADIGTGSGAIAVSLALALPKAKVYATDISASALEVASINRQRHKVDKQIELLQGNLLDPLPEPADMIVANLPYVRDSELQALAPEIIYFEPRLAIAGGNNGWDRIRLLLDQIPGRLHPEGCLLLEIGQGQDKTVSSMIDSHFPQAVVELVPDPSGTNRVVKIILKSECA